jgi:hypothetical protein
MITFVLALKINFSPPVTARKLALGGIVTLLIKYADALDTVSVNRMLT